MLEEKVEAPENLAQASVQEGSDATPPTTEVDGAQGQEPTPTQDESSNDATPNEGTQVAEQQEEVAAQEATPPPARWEGLGFKSEDEFYKSFDEGRKTLGEVFRDKARLEKATEAYRGFIDGTVDAADIETYIKEQQVAADQTQTAHDVETERAKLACTKFKMDHNDMNIGEDDMRRIILLAPEGGSYDERLSKGLEELQAVKASVKREAAVVTQKTMAARSDISAGTPAKADTSPHPDFKGMTSEEFQAYRTKVQMQ